MPSTAPLAITRAMPEPIDDERDIATRDHLLVHRGAELHIKSARTRRRFERALVHHLSATLAKRAPDARLVRRRQRLHVLADDLERAALAAADTFGVHRVTHVRPVTYSSLDDLAAQVGDLMRERVRGRSFAVRTRRRGHQGWTSEEANRTIGGALYDAARKVDLTSPEVTVQVEVYPEVAHVVLQTWRGPDGLPIGTQERALSLISGGFDSPVASWQMLRRGCVLDYIHFKLECSQSEHALSVAHLLWERWGGGTRPVFYRVDFQPIKEALLAHVDSRVRQVVLKRMMFATADGLAGRLGMHALVTGEALGQVSSQTLSHLAAIDQFCHRTVLRPLAGALKQEIIDRARAIGTEAISARAVEVCDLSDGPVNVTARWAQLARAQDALPEGLVEAALERLEVIALPDWMPGAPFVPVLAVAPEGVPLIDARDTDDQLPPEGPVALCGPRAADLASRLSKEGRDVTVVLTPRPPFQPPSQ